MAFVFCFLAHHPSSLELLDYLKAVYITMLPKPVFIPSGGLFHLYLRYWPQSKLFIIGLALDGRVARPLAHGGKCIFTLRAFVKSEDRDALG